MPQARFGNWLADVGLFWYRISMYWIVPVGVHDVDPTPLLK